MWKSNHRGGPWEDLGEDPGGGPGEDLGEGLGEDPGRRITSMQKGTQ